MRVREVETFVVGNPPPEFGGRYFVFVKLTASDGTVGYGEAYAATFRPTGERLITNYEFARLLEARAAAIVQPNVARAGGLLEGKKIAALAEAFGAQLAPHCYNGPIGLAANVQLATCSPNFLVIETIGDCSGFHADLLRDPLRVEDGRLVPPTGPGLGVELDEAVARAHPYRGDEPHLSMWSVPIDETDETER